MGTTDNLALRYPDPDDLVKDGAAAIQVLAEDVEAQLWAPLLSVQPATVDALDDEVATWNTGAPVAVRGAWTFITDNTVLVPPTPGVYLLTAHIAAASSLDHDLALSIETNLASGVDSPAPFGEALIEGSTGGTELQYLSTSAIIVLTDPLTLGFQLRVTGVPLRLTAYRLASVEAP